MALSQILQLGFFAGLGVSLVGKSMLPAPVAEFTNANPMLTFGLLFGCNVLAGKLVNTGAFEVTYKGVPVWSKLETGRFPQLPELVDALDGAVARAHNAAIAD